MSAVTLNFLKEQILVLANNGVFFSSLTHPEDHFKFMVITPAALTHEDLKALAAITNVMAVLELEDSDEVKTFCGKLCAALTADGFTKHNYLISLKMLDIEITDSVRKKFAVHPEQAGKKTPFLISHGPDFSEISVVWISWCMEQLGVDEAKATDLALQSVRQAFHSFINATTLGELNSRNPVYNKLINKLGFREPLVPSHIYKVLNELEVRTVQKVQRSNGWG